MNVFEAIGNRELTDRELDRIRRTCAKLGKHFLRYFPYEDEMGEYTIQVASSIPNEDEVILESETEYYHLIVFKYGTMLLERDYYNNK